MRLRNLKLFMLVSFFSAFSIHHLSAQNCFNTGLNGTVINLPCNQTCVNVPVKIPHLKSTSDYIVNSVPYHPFAYVTPGGSEYADLYNDDTYSSVINLPFSFCFFDAVYNKIVVGSNGLVTFDESNASCDNAYTITPTIPSAGSSPQCSRFGTYYPRASIMGCYTDLDPRPGPDDDEEASPADRKIEWRVEGSAPCRRFVVSFYHIGSYGVEVCSQATPTTFQMVIYESTGVVEVFIQNKTCNATTSDEAILGIQNWNRNKAVVAPGKNATVWSASNQGYRFTPSGGVSRFKSCKVYDLSGNFIADGDTATTTQGILDVTFPNFCPSGTGTRYEIRTTFISCEATAAELTSSDTITINRTTDLNATAAITKTSCGVNSGAATVTVPAGIGTAPYTFLLMPGNVTQTPSGASATFSNLAAGHYTVSVNDAGGCSSTVPVFVESTGILSVSYNPVNTICAGGANGQIVADPPNGTAPYTFVLNPGNITQNSAAGTTFTGLAAGTYFISAYDVGGCKAENIPVTVDNGPSITLTAEAHATSCVGANNGSITVTGSTGTAPFRYSINGGAFQTNPTFSNLAPGTYFISLRDVNNCPVDFIPVTVEQGNGTLTGTATPTATTCSGASNGSITITPTTGSGPYEYSINSGTNWQSGNTFSGLAAGSYSVLIREGGLCQSNPISVTIPAGAALTGTATSTATACTGVNNGTITITPGSSFTGPFEYKLDAGAYQSSATFNGVAAGNHTVMIRNTAGCVSAGISVTVAAGTALTATVTPANTSCSGAADGTITVAPTNGGAPYQYALDGGAYQAAATFTGVAAGAHTIKFKDNFGCISADLPVTVTAGPVLSGTATSTSTACIGVNNGTVTATAATGFAGPFEYSLDGGAYQSSNAFSGVAAGSHAVKIRNAAGCISADINVSVATGSTLTATTSSTNTSCSGATDGTITVTPTNGGAPYQYALDGGTFQSAATFTGVAAGAHTIKFKDNFGCISPDIPVTITAGPVLAGTATSTATACTGVNNGTITATAGNAFTGPFEYSLDGGTYQSSGTFSAVAAGAHNVKVRNAAGCVSADIPVTVAAGSVLDAVLSWVNTSCSGAADATLTVSPKNGTAPYQYSLDGGTYQASATFTGIAAGPHNIKFKDNFGCISPDIPFTVIVGPVLTGSATSTATACAGVNNGTITATPTTGFTGPFTYALDGGTYQSAATFSGVAAGPHNVKIRNAAGCISADIPVTVAAGSALTGTATATDANCNATATGSITVTATNGSGPYQYALNGGAYQSSNAFTGLAANTYNVTIKDAFGCTSAQIPVTINQPAALAIAAPVVQNVSCYGASDGSIAVTVTGGTTPYTYSLNNSTFQPANTFNVAQGAYTVYVKDTKGCPAQYPNIAVTQPTALAASVASTTNATCNGGADGVIEVAANGGTAPYQYAYDGTNFQASNLLYVRSGTYTVTVKDAHNCILTIPGVEVEMTDNLALTVATPAPICEGSSVQLEASGNATGYTWSSAAGNSSINGPASANPVVSPRTTTTYNVAATLGNCSANESVTVTVLPAPVPDAGSNTEICYGQETQLHGSGGTTYAWTPSTYLDDPTSASPQVVKPLKTITYSLHVTDANNCSSLTPDQVTVTVIPPIKVKVTPLDTVVYAGAQFQLQATSVGTHYEWSPASGLNNPYIADPVAVAPMLEGAEVTYTVTASTAAGCQGEGYATVRVYKGPEIYMVNAFTPNRDGKNELFIPIPVGIKQLTYFRVFNRWGQLVFSTNALHKGWDGKWSGIEQPNGVYVWMVQGITDAGSVITKKGTVTLIR